MTGAGEAIAAGARITAVFPQMAGKLRPGVVAAVGAGVVAATPMTTRRTNQAGRLPSPADPTGVWDRESWLLLPMTALLPLRRVESVAGVVSAADRARLAAGLALWFGADWPAREPGLGGPLKTPRVMTPRTSGRKARRDRARAWSAFLAEDGGA